MIAALVANFPDKPVRFSAILGLFTPILITFFPWQILQKNIILGFLGILIFILLVITFLSGFQESRSEMLSEQKVPNIALTMHFVLYSLVSSGMIFAGLMRQNTIAVTKKFIIISIISACSFLEKRGFILRKI